MKRIILAIDIQNEYITEGRPFHICSIQDSLRNAAMIITSARLESIPVWHVKHEQTERIFVKGNPLTDFVDSCKPQKDEKVFSKDLYSCFSSKEFTESLAAEKPDEIIIIGYGSSMCCLCTTIEGIHRGYQFMIVEDATASKANGDISESEMHRSALNILKQYTKIIKTDELIQGLCSEAS